MVLVVLGRIDITIKLADFIYIIEFRVGDGDALRQTIERGYSQKYENEAKEIIFIGVNFDKELRNISKFEYERTCKTTTINPKNSKK